MSHECDKSIGRCISIVYRHMNVFFKHRLEPYGLSPSEMMTLLNMVDNDGVNQESLRDGLKYDKGVMARIVKSLIEKGYLTKAHSETDKRAYQITRSDRAKDFEPVIFKLLYDWNQVLVGGEDEEEIEQLKGQLNTIADRVIRKVEDIVNE